MITTLLLALTLVTTDTIEPTYESKRLFEVINAKRRIDEVPELRMDKGLNYLAYLHCVDLYKYSDDDCSLISWSKQSGYSYGCVNKENPKLDIMHSKPREVLGYNGLGYEIACLSNMNVNYEMAYTLIRSSEFYTKLMTDPEFTRVGVCVYKNVVSVWLMK